MKSTHAIELRVIRTESDYEQTLNELETLILADPENGTRERDKLELLTMLIREYESRNYKFDALDPVDAIEVKMEEKGLRQKDIAPLLGGRNRASEVLSRKRPLTLDMIRALHNVLHIPLHILVSPERTADGREADAANADDRFEWNKFPIAEMRKRGWFDGLDLKRKNDAEALVRAFLSRIGTKVEAVPALFRRTFRGITTKAASHYALIAWTAQVLIRAKASEEAVPAFSAEKLDDRLFRELARLSSFDRGPRMAVDFLKNCGVIVIVEPSLPSVLVDGAALMTESGRAVVGLTLRYDRVDNFWFTLLHELAHVRHHLTKPSEGFVDRIDDEAPTDPLEQEANHFAREALIPRSHWRTSVVSATPSKKSIIAFAKYMDIHEAIVAGRIRYETKRFDRFTDLLGHGKVRELFFET